jgi:Zn-dependent peptidase ImmA (M78 family)
MIADEYTVDWRVGAWTNDSRVEWLIDAFARALLLPAASVRTRWAELKARESVRDAAVRIGSEYRVDMSTLASRLTELKLEDSDNLLVVRGAKTTRADIIENDLVVAHDLDGMTLPRRYEKAVMALYRAERISAARAVDLLRNTITEADLPTLPPVDVNEIWKFVS